MGVTMNSIPEPEWDCWNFNDEGKLAQYKDEHLAEKEDDD